jgi:hypothetical protein
VSDIDARVFELGLQGRCCAQILVTLALEEVGAEDQLLADVVAGLCYGLSEELLCGALSGGALALGVLAGGPVNAVVVSDLVDWFKEQYGTTQCGDVLGDDPAARVTRCPGIVAATFQEVLELAEAYGVYPR